MRNSSLLMWRRFLTIALLVAAVGCLGDDKAPTAGAQEADAKGPSPETRRRPASGGRPAIPRPPRPFQPSEKISADSAVSFPVDI